MSNKLLYLLYDVAFISVALFVLVSHPLGAWVGLRSGIFGTFWTSYRVFFYKEATCILRNQLLNFIHFEIIVTFCKYLALRIIIIVIIIIICLQNTAS